MKKLISLATSLMMTMLIAATIIVPASGAGEVAPIAPYTTPTVAIEPVNTTNTPQSTLVITEDDLKDGDVTEEIGVYLYNEISFAAITWNIGLNTEEIEMMPIDIPENEALNDGRAIVGQSGNAQGGIMGPINSGTGDEMTFAAAVGEFVNGQRYNITYAKRTSLLKADGATTSANPTYDNASDTLEGTKRREYFLNKFELKFPQDMKRGVYKVMFDWTEGDGTEKGAFMITRGNESSDTVDITDTMTFNDLTIVVGDINQITLDIEDVTVDPATAEILEAEDGTKYTIASVPVKIYGDAANQMFVGLQTNLVVSSGDEDLADVAAVCYPDEVTREITDTYGDKITLNEDGALSKGDVDFDSKSINMDRNATSGGYPIAFAIKKGSTEPLEDGTTLFIINFVIENISEDMEPVTYDLEFAGGGFTQLSLYLDGAVDSTNTIGAAGEFVLEPGSISVLGVEPEPDTTTPTTATTPAPTAAPTTAATEEPGPQGEATGGIVAAMVVLALAGAAAVVAKKKFN